MSQQHSVNLLKYLDLAKWEHNNDNHYQWQGELTFDDFPRLSVLQDETHQQSPLVVSVDIQKKGDIIFLHLQTNGCLWQDCQRCLAPVAVDLSLDCVFALLTDENHVALLDEDVEPILLAEVVDEKDKLWLLPLIEDELLVTLPLSPKHDNCEMSVSQVGEVIEIEEEKENPFAVLAGLKGKLS